MNTQPSVPAFITHANSECKKYIHLCGEICLHGFIWKSGINFAVCINWIDEIWWNNRLTKWWVFKLRTKASISSHILISFGKEFHARDPRTINFGSFGTLACLDCGSSNGRPSNMPHYHWRSITGGLFGLAWKIIFTIQSIYTNVMYHTNLIHSINSVYWSMIVENNYRVQVFCNTKIFTARHLVVMWNQTMMAEVDLAASLEKFFLICATKCAFCLFSVTGPLGREFTALRWLPRTKAIIYCIYCEYHEKLKSHFQNEWLSCLKVK